MFKHLTFKGQKGYFVKLWPFLKQTIKKQGYPQQVNGMVDCIQASK